MALALGRTVAELEVTLGAVEFDAWKEFYSLEPWGSYRDNLHAGIIAATIGNINRRKKGKPLTPSDFVLRTKDEKRNTETAKSLNFLRAIGVKRGN